MKMKGKWFSNLWVALAAMAVCVSCEKAYDFDEDTDTESVSDGQLVVRAITADGDSETSTISYPVCVYVMDSSGSCIALKEIASADETLNFVLEAGIYDVYAIAGSSNYDLPSKENATKSSIVTPKSGKGHGDLMTAYNSIVMVKGEKNQLSLQLQRRVMQVQQILLNDIPTDVTAVSLTISPLHKGIMLNGEYQDGTDSYTFELQKQADGSTWKNKDSAYLLEALNTVTLKVTLTRDDSATAYSYACSEALSANYKVNITGTFVDDEHISLSGSIVGAEWAGTKDIAFNFDSSNLASSDEENDSDNQGIQQGNAPQVGTLYKGCFVLRSSQDGDNTVITLLSPTEVNKLKISQSKDAEVVQQSIKDATATALSSVAVDGISGWRLPTKEEMEYLDQNTETINAQMETLDAGLTTITQKKGAYNCGYFFEDTDGNVYVYTLVTGVIDETPSSERATYKVRGFATLTFSN